MKSIVVFSAGLLFATSLLSFAQQQPDLGSIDSPGLVQREITPGQTHTYQLPLVPGQWVRLSLKIEGLGAGLSIVGPEGTLVARRVARDGQEATYPRLEFVSKIGGVHRVVIGVVPWGRQGQYELNVEEILTPEQSRARIAAKAASQPAAVRWLAANAIPIQTASPGTGVSDLRPLRQWIGNARIVGLGEATHGTREFFQLKHRVFEFLVTEMAFTAFAIEASMPEAFDINRYVLIGEGDPERALAGLYFWTWNTEEVRDLIEWMRRYNADSRHRRKVRFYGIDMQHPLRARKVVLSYLQKVDPHEAAEAEKSFGILINPLTEQLPLPVKPLQDRAAAYQQTLLDRFDSRKAAYQQISGLLEWEFARQHLRILIQNSDAAAGSRDRSMAENVAWVLEREGPQGKIAVWGHNGHVSLSQNSMGGHLRHRFGGDYFVLGFAFNQGGFQALRFGTGSASGELHSFMVDPAPAGSLDAVLAAAGQPIMAAPLRTLPATGPVAEWFNSIPLTRNVGSGYVEDWANNLLYYFDNTPVADHYDALLFVEKTTAARALPGSRRVAVPTVPQPRNLDFEVGSPGEIPPGWIAAPPQLFRAESQPVFGFQVATTAERPFAGRQCVEVKRPPGVHYGERPGGLGQRIDARPYRGKRIRLQAAVRTEVAGAGNQAHLWLALSTGQAEAMLDHPITAGEWRLYELFANIPESAEFVEAGMVLVGVGRAWLDSVSITVLEKPD